MSNFNFNSGKWTCSGQQCLENHYSQSLISIHTYYQQWTWSRLHLITKTKRMSNSKSFLYLYNNMTLLYIPNFGIEKVTFLNEYYFYLLFLLYQFLSLFYLMFATKKWWEISFRFSKYTFIFIFFLERYKKKDARYIVSWWVAIITHYSIIFRSDI